MACPIRKRFRMVQFSDNMDYPDRQDDRSPRDESGQTMPDDLPVSEIITPIPREVKRIILTPGPEQPCSYLPGRKARFLSLNVSQFPAGIYHSLMNHNFRRSGTTIYRPVCSECSQCRAIRVPVRTFAPNRSQRRCRRMNGDLDIEINPPKPDFEKHALYARYLQARHNRVMASEWSEFVSFLYESPVQTFEVVYRLGLSIAAVAIFDLEPEAISTVYCYHDPGWSARSLGTFNILWTIEHAREKHIPYVYLGYYIRDCPKMNYKARFKPHELYDSDDQWHENRTRAED